MVIYTKTGDKGNTKVFDIKTGKLVEISKKSCKIKVIGAIDELNSFLGIVKSEMGSEKWEVSENIRRQYIKKIQEIQGDLFTINSILAGANIKLQSYRVTELERDIDEMEGVLPVQKNFIYYGGTEVASMLFYARALARRAERSLVSFSRISHIPLLTSHILPYLNRLSDYLFILGRFVNYRKGIKEVFWIGKRK